MQTDIPIPCPDRLRRRHGSFGWIEHRFVRDGFLALVADARGLSFYSPERMRYLLGIPHAHTLEDALSELVARDLLAHRNGIFQVLDLPAQPVVPDYLRPHP